MNVWIISTYRGDLENSLCSILCPALVELGFNARFINFKDKGLSDINDPSIIIGQPKHMNMVLSRVKSKQIILYNLESLSRCPKYRHMMLENLNDKRIKQFWVYDENQMSLFKDKARFCPIGFNESIENNDTINVITNRIAFIGTVQKYRRLFFEQIRKLGLPVDVFNSRAVGDSISKAGLYAFGLDSDDYTNQIEKHRWHRLMLYAANHLVFVSTTDWSKYGLIDGKHYLKCRNPNELVAKIGSTKEPFKIANELLSKVRTDYMMSDIIRSHMGKLKWLEGV